MIIGVIVFFIEKRKLIKSEMFIFYTKQFMESKKAERAENGESF